MEKTYSYRTTDENFIKYLDEHWDGSFSRFVNASKDKELRIIKNNRFKTFFDKNLYTVLTLGLGSILLIFSMYTYNVFIFIASMMIGGFLVIYALLGIFIEVMSIWKTS